MFSRLLLAGSAPQPSRISRQHLGDVFDRLGNLCGEAGVITRYAAVAGDADPQREGYLAAEVRRLSSWRSLPFGLDGYRFAHREII